MLLEKGLKFYAVNFMRFNAKNFCDTTSAIRHQIHVRIAVSNPDVRSNPESDIDCGHRNVR